MTDIYEFPVDEAKTRVVPAWQRSGQLRRLPNPYWNDDALLLNVLLHSPSKVKQLLRSSLGKEKIRAFVEANSILFDYMARFKRNLLRQLGIVVASAPIGIEAMSPEETEDDGFLDEYAEELKLFADIEDTEELAKVFPEYLRAYSEELVAIGKK